MTSVPRTAVIVGAGIVGAACADALATSGVAVRVVERERPGTAGATAAGMGHILVLDDSPAQIALTKLGRELWDARADRWPTRVERHVCGTLWVAADDEELAGARQRAEVYERWGVASRVVDADELRLLEPNLRGGLAGGLLVPGDSVVYPPNAARVLLDAAVSAGAAVVERAPVTAVGDGWAELADGTRLEADVVVVAAGIATPRLVPGSGLSIVPKKGHLAITDRYPGFVRHQLVELGYLKSAHGAVRQSVAFNIQPRPNGQMLLGSSRQLDDDDPRVDRCILAAMVARGIDYLPRLAALSVLRTWVGFRPATPDNLPVVGPLADRPGLWVATGHEGVGITTSLATARLVADRLCGREPPIDPGPYDTSRLREASTHA
ncbi:MAG: FAD-binding oxidoreductase [Planctomycetes bacterium]|nr:FAD-binding oxidoreductase [Planctomycetota bacterium]